MYIDIPAFIGRTKSVIIIKNNDYCFLWSVVCGLYLAAKNKNRTSSYPHFSKVLQFTNIQFNIALNDIPKIENMNKLNLNVFCCCNENEILPLMLQRC